MQQHLLTRLLLFVLCLSGAAANAEDANIPGFAEAADDAARGLAVAEEADRRGAGFGDTSATMSMVLRNAAGDSVQRAMRSRTLEMGDDGDRNLIVFDDPADVRGTAFLTHSHPSADDDQWLYLPALKRVKRIASRGRAGSFMSSEFSYEDLSPEEVEKYRYRYLRAGQLSGEAVHVLERYPLGPSGYTRQIVWLDRAELRVRKVEYYDRKQSLLKTLTVGEYAQFLEQYWRPLHMEMVNHQTGRSTTLRWSDYAFRTGLDARDFNRNALAKAR